MLKFKKWAVIGLATMIGVMGVSCTSDDDDPVYPDTYVRFTWRASDQPDIYAISASRNDVADWYERVYDAGFADIYGDIPKFNGSRQLPDNIYSSTSGNQHKGQYHLIDRGSYTAICEAGDEYADFDIVANYDIWLDGPDDPWVYFEIAFNVQGVIEGWVDDGLADAYAYDYWDDYWEPPMLAKSLASKKGIEIRKTKPQITEKNGAKMKVTYYVVRKPKN